MKLGKMMALLLVLALALPLGAQAEGAGQVVDGVFRYDETVDIHVIMSYNSSVVEDPLKMWLHEWARQEMNINFIIDAIPNETARERTSLMFAASDYPEVIFNWGYGINSLTAQTEYGDQEGQLVALNKWMTDPAIMPNIAAFMAEYENQLALFSTLQGNVYSIPVIAQKMEYVVNMSYQPIWYDKTVLETLGMDAPTTLEALREVLLAIKAQDPKGLGADNNIPLGGADWNYIPWGMILNALGFNTTNPYAIASLRGGALNEGGEVVSQQTHPVYLAFLQYANSLFAEGLLEPDYFTQEGNQAAAKAGADYYSFFPSYNPYSFSEETWQNYAVLPPMTSEHNDTQIYTTGASIGNGYQVFITDKATDLQAEATMRFFDMLYDPDFRYNAYYGPEAGVDDGYGLLEGWYVGEDGSTYVYKDVESGKFEANNVYLWNVGPIYVTGNILDRRTDGSETTMFNPETRAGKMNLEIFTNGTPYLVRGLPVALFEVSEQLRMNDLVSVLDDHIETEVAKFITGAREPSEAEFEAYVNELNAMGLQEYIEAYARNMEERFPN